MTAESDVWSARRAANAKYGDKLFEESSIQRNLRFKVEGNVIFDAAANGNLAYYYPSAVGSALFFYGSFEDGEIGFCRRYLECEQAPVIFDVGANIGSHTTAWAHGLPDATVYAFEPVPSNLELLGANVQAQGLAGRVVIVPSAVGAHGGTAHFFETDDAAYSSFVDTRRRAVVRTFEAELLTLDSFVASNNIERISLVKIDVEGFEDDVLAGAEDTLERLRPALFIEIFGGAASNPDPEHTVRTLRKRGYVPYVISDGFATPYERHDDAFYNYFFLHESRPQALPAPDLHSIRRTLRNHAEMQNKLTVDLEKRTGELANAVAQWRRAISEWEILDRSVREKDAALQEKDASLQEKDASLQEKDAALQEKDALISALNASAEDLRKQLLASAASVREKDAALQDIDAAGGRLHKELAARELAMTEKDVRITELSGAAHGLRTTLESLSAQLQEKEAALQSLHESYDEISSQASALQSALQEKDSALRAVHEEMEMLRSVAHERLTMISELDEVAQERLSVIRSLNSQLEAK